MGLGFQDRVVGFAKKVVVSLPVSNDKNGGGERDRKRGAALLVREICEVAARRHKGKAARSSTDASGVCAGVCGPAVGDASSSSRRPNQARRKCAKKQGPLSGLSSAEGFLVVAPHPG